MRLARAEASRPRALRKIVSVIFLAIPPSGGTLSCVSRGFVFLRESRVLQTPMSVLPFPRARFRIHLLGEEVDAGGDESGHETLGHVVHGVLALELLEDAVLGVERVEEGDEGDGGDGELQVLHLVHRVGHGNHGPRGASRREQRDGGRGGFEVVGDDLRGHEKELEPVRGHDEGARVDVVLGCENGHG